MSELLVLHEPHTEAHFDPYAQLLSKRVLRLVAPPQSHLLSIAESMTEIDDSFAISNSPNYTVSAPDEFELGDVDTFAIVTESPAWADALSRQLSEDSSERLAQLIKAQETLLWILRQTDQNPWALQLIDNNFHDPSEAAEAIIKIATSGGSLNRELIRTIQRMLVSVESMPPLVNELYRQKRGDS